MKSLIAVSALMMMLVASQPAPSIPPIPPSPHHSSGGGSGHAILVKICNNTLRCFGDNCKTYVVPDQHCFTHIPGESLEFSCQAFDTCVKGSQYFGDKCSGGFGRNFSLPANTCLGQRYVHVADNAMTMYNCAGSPTCHSGDYTKCTKVFGPDALGSCAHMKSPHGYYNISMDLSTDSGSCHEIKVRPYRNAQCLTRAPPRGPSPAPKERALEAQSLKIETPIAVDAAVSVPPAPSGHHSHGHGRPHHGGAHSSYFYLPEEADDEVMNLIQAHMEEKKEDHHFLGGRPHHQGADEHRHEHHDQQHQHHHQVAEHQRHDGHHDQQHQQHHPRIGHYRA